MLPDAQPASAVDTAEPDWVNELKVSQQVCAFGREEIPYVLSDTQLI